MIKKEILEELYVNQELSMNEVAKKLNVSVGSVYNYIKKYGIKSRPKMTEKTRKKISEANKGKISPMKGKHWTSERKRKMSEAKKGKFLKPSKYGGHRKKRKDGYITIYKPNHPLASKDGYIMEHILVMEERNKRDVLRIIGDDYDNKVHLLLEYTNSPSDIEDPWYTGEFDKVYDQIYNGCIGLYNYLLDKEAEDGE